MGSSACSVTIGGAGRQVLTQVDLADAEPARERCLDDLFPDQACCATTCALADLSVDTSVSIVAWLIASAANCSLVALQRLLGELRRRLQLLELGVVVVRLELEQHLARRHVVAGIERDLVDDARGLCGEIRAAHGAQAPDRLDLALPGRTSGRSPVDTVWGALAALRHVLADHLAHEGLPGEHAAEHQGDAAAP